MNKWVQIKQNKVVKALILVSLILIAIMISSRIDYSLIQRFIQNHRYLGIFLCVFLYACLGATPVPSEPFTIVLSGLCGPIWTIFMVTIGNTAAAFVEYLIGSQVSDITEFTQRKVTLPKFLKKLPIDSPVFQIFGRVIPGVGAKFVGITSGMYRISLFTFFWTAILSNFAGAAIVAYGGYGLFELL
ncbi:uncharacterized membrane protein YdjX, TVP38/TMEM64 family, SNARE-associated domain [Flexilinea flocculi]|uniref:Uncharacterized membrane protein YdjX, TVP38/TMEM64 family, SNARE-associated domain n=2 Tax=Flexilinea flocculi TaxID=1678840 RepID=A0A0S7BXS4_9CHLR|nr:uncharacterized membrane protein YdjX, TVP38/TMEM64 family, SNARE-associated domain [Flexilinea flocculi]